MTAADLLPCPFCGYAAYIEQLGDRRKSTIYACQECGCRLETGEENDHGARWNTRAIPLPAEPAMAVKVRPLVWDPYNRADDYKVEKTFSQGPKAYVMARGSKIIGWFDTIAEGKAAAQSDYDARILAAIEPAPMTIADAARGISDAWFIEHDGENHTRADLLLALEENPRHPERGVKAALHAMLK